MGRLVTVSVRVSEDLKRRAERLGVNISRVLREALEREVRRLEARAVVERMREAAARGPRLPPDTIASIIREYREGR